MRAEEVLDLQGDFLSRISNTVFGDIVSSVVNAQFNDRQIKSSLETSLLMASHARAAYAYHVTDRMTDVVVRRAQSYPDDTMIGSIDRPTDIGFAVLDTPISTTEIRGHEQLIHAIMWGPVNTNLGTGIFISLWNDTIRGPDEVHQQQIHDAMTLKRAHPSDYDRVRQITGRWDLITVHVVPRAYDAPIGPYMIEPNDEQIADSVKRDLRWQPGHNTMRFVLALWHLMGEVVSSSGDVGRAYRRRAEKAKLPARVTVVALRRNDHGETIEPTHIDWQHRWHVRGHYRTIRDRQTGEIKRKVWISEYIKGPEGKPIIDSRKVYDLRR